MADPNTTGDDFKPIRQVLAGCLGDADFRLLVEGPYGPREIDLLIGALRVTQAALREPRAPACGPLICDGWNL